MRAARLLALAVGAGSLGSCTNIKDIGLFECDPLVGLNLSSSSDAAPRTVTAIIQDLDHCGPLVAQWNAEGSSLAACPNVAVDDLVDDGGGQRATDCEVPYEVARVCVQLVDRGDELVGLPTCLDIGAWECTSPALTLDDPLGTSGAATFTEGPLAVRGQVALDEGVRGSEVTVSAEAIGEDGAVFSADEAPQVDDDGVFTVTLDLDPSVVRLDVRAQRLDCEADYVVQQAVVVRPGGSGPSCEISAPEDEGQGVLDEPVRVEGAAEDDFDLPDDLQYTLSSDLDGVLDEGNFGSDGTFVFAVSDLSEGWHVLELECLDLDGYGNTDLITFEVVDCMRRVYYDADGDGHGDPDTFMDTCEVDGSGLWVRASDDCDDTTGDVHPGHPELCDGEDNDCDGIADNGVVYSDHYPDFDGDGFGDTRVAPVSSCTTVPGFVTIGPDGADCNDRDAAIFPTAVEVCNGVDDDCDGDSDALDAGISAALLTTQYRDADGDGFGAGVAVADCVVRPGYDTDSSDCDDSRATVFPGAVEAAGDGLDQSCDGYEVCFRDIDGDGFRSLLTVSSTDLSCSTAGLALATAPGVDCADTVAAVNPGAAEVCNGTDDDCSGVIDDGLPFVSYYADLDGDGVGAGAGVSACAPISGWVTATGDCDDAVASTFPGAAEVCNLVDDDCDGVVDDGLPVTTYYRDGDSDGFGAGSASSTCAATLPAGTSTVAGDCDDARASVNPGGTEVCNGVDDDCSGVVDDPSLLSYRDYYTDADTDGFGAGAALSACASVPGRVTNASDCDDTRASVSPSGTEVCNGIDDDCSGVVDDPSLLSYRDYYTDADADGYGAGAALSACAAVAGRVTNVTDCDDTRASVSPAGTELCNGIDDDCSGVVDDPSLLSYRDYYADVDTDGFGSGPGLSACAAVSGRVTNATDCDDGRATVYPGAPETCDHLDNDCDAVIDDGLAVSSYYIDADADGFGAGAALSACASVAGRVTNSTDCDDGNSTIYPSATEVCDGDDNDCDGLVDGDDPGVDRSTLGTYFRDGDGDGYGNTSLSTLSCSVPSGYVNNDDDCDDGRATVFPSAPELCDSLDNDCDLSTDEGLTFTSYYTDSDRDGYGAGSALSACAPVSGRVTNNLDCNDASSAVRPGATELVGDSVDQDCDGTERCYVDADNDSYAISSTMTSSDTDCNDSGEATSSDPRTDCDDTSSAVNPGATEIVGDGIDQSCDGRETCYTDADNDGYRLSSTRSSSDADCADSGEAYSYEPTGDCNDSSSSVSPAASEVCDGVDNDCDGSIDEGFSATTYYRDADGDGYGTSATTTTACSGRPSGYVTNATDCDDSRSSVKPGGSESCNGRDDDCDGASDEGGVCGESPGYCSDGLDNDSDGFADCQDIECAGETACTPTITTVSCSTMERGSVTTCTVTGRNFMSGASAFVGDLASPVYNYVSPTSFQVRGTWICNQLLTRKDVAYLHPGGASGSSCGSTEKACATMTSPTVMGSVDLLSVTPGTVTGRTTTTFTMSGCNLCPSSGTPVAYIANVTGVSTTCSGSGDAVYYRGTPTGTTGAQACAIAHTSGATGRYRDDIASCVTLR